VPQGKAFFLERKNQRTFINWRRVLEQIGTMVQMRGEKRFLLLFFKKECLPSFSNQRQHCSLGNDHD
jgi:hypothetical protein